MHPETIKRMRESSFTKEQDITSLLAKLLGISSMRLKVTHTITNPHSQTDEFTCSLDGQEPVWTCAPYNFHFPQVETVAEAFADKLKSSQAVAAAKGEG